MQYLYDALGLAQTAFTVWMLVDAYRRSADFFWFWVIFLLQPIGPWVYFFAVKAGDFSGLRDWSFFQHRPSLEELRYRAEQLATPSNHLALAERLVEQQEYDEAVPHLEAVLAREPELGQALYTLALCHAEEGRHEKAVALLEKLIARDRTWSNYSAWRLLVRVQAESEQGERSLCTCRELARLAPTLQHQCLLAERLLDEGETEEARELLQRSLDDHRFAPGFVRRQNRRWASRARQLQRQLPVR